MRALNCDPAYESDTPRTQIVFPLQGVHYIETGPRETLLDLNHVAVIPRGLTTRDRHPSTGNVSCLVVTPSPELLEEASRGSDLPAHAFCQAMCITRPIAPEDQVRTAMLAARCRIEKTNSATLEEILLSLIRSTAFGISKRRVDVGPRSLALVQKVRDLLTETNAPVSITSIAREIGASPTYLTDLFRKVEGMPIYRYQMRLRLARSLADLPGAEDILTLALDLGFSSHSHFSNVFKATYGISPSRFRENTRRRNAR